MADDGACCDLFRLLSSPARDFLIRNTGQKVDIRNLVQKKVGLYFGASWFGPCQRFSSTLVEVYKELVFQGCSFEIVFISADEDEESFAGYFSKMPWLAVPFSNSDAQDRLEELFKVEKVPHLVILDEDGKVITGAGVDVIGDYGAEGYPFTPARIKELKDQVVAARKNQTLRSVLVSPWREFVVSRDGKSVPVSEIEGKTIGLYFSMSSYKSCLDFTPMLVDVYEKLKDKGEKFEVVLIPLDSDEEMFKKRFSSMPWFSLPFKDKSHEKLVQYFEISTLPALVIIGPDGKTVNHNAAETIQDYGIQAYPFTQEKLNEVAKIEKQREDAQTLESILVCGNQDYVINSSRNKVLVSDLVGKNILLYFSAHWCPPCRAFLRKLSEAYKQIKAKDKSFEVILISNDMDESSFNEFFADMPWLALPFNDPRKDSLNRWFKVRGSPKVVAISPSGKTITTNARDLLSDHGAEAYPFTDERMQEIEAGYKEMAKGWPEKVEHCLHKEHELLLTRCMLYICDGCEKEGHIWGFKCQECEFTLHPNCVLEEGTGKNKQSWQ